MKKCWRQAWIKPNGDFTQSCRALKVSPGSQDVWVPGSHDPRILESQDTGSQDAWIYLQPAQPPPSHSLVLESSFNMKARVKPGALNVFQLKGKVGELNPNISIDRQCNFLLNISSLKCWRSCWFHVGDADYFADFVGDADMQIAPVGEGKEKGPGMLFRGG